MFYHLFYPLKDIWFGFNIFRYITFRASFAGVTAFLITVFIAPVIIRKLEGIGAKEIAYRKDCPSLYGFYDKKKGTPTMGGIIIISGVVLSTLLWADLKNRFILISLFCTIWLGMVGFLDDYLKLFRKSSKGMKASAKLTGQIFLGLILGVYLFLSSDFPTTLDIPFLKKIIIDLGPFFILFVTLVLVGSSNSVNITDGLDGLAIGCATIIAFTYAILSYITGHIKFSEYLNVFYLSGTGELSIFCLSIAGAGLGFLWYNCFPATVFMGDTGALALGGAIGVVAVLIKKELLLVLVGGIFVIEALSVIAQVFSFKLRKKRIFRMAPLHHHFQLLGWQETKVTVRLWIVAIILALITIATLKIR